MAPPIFIHLTVRTRYPLRPLLDRDACADLWARLRRRFNQGVLACILMPNHLHLDLEGWDPEHAREQLSLELKAFSQSRYPGQRIWDPVPAPQNLADRFHLQRHIRYVLLNPCRARLAQDPLEWEWSTHRDSVGVTMDSWVEPRRLAELLGVTTRHFAREFHSYVSSDPTVKVGGTLLPPQVELSQVVTRLDHVGDAVLQVTRLPTRALQRRGSRARALAAHLAWQLGGRNQAALAAWLNMKERGLRTLLATTPPKLGPALWVLANLARFKTARAENRRLEGESSLDSGSDDQKPTFRGADPVSRHDPGFTP